ncbi:MAG TPA: M3 family peptidase [Gammaproteobacteria bacterium]|nr:M3 family peptidase [Gammaproteobacteria bacterium]
MPNNITPNFSPKDIVNTIDEITKSGINQVEICVNGDDWDSVVKPLDIVEHELGRCMSVNSHINSVMYTDKFNTEYEKTLPIISKYYSEIASNKSLYKAYKRVSKTNLDSRQRHIIKDAIKGFELSGVALEGDKLKRLKKIKEELTLLSSKFSNNSLKATNEWKKIVTRQGLDGYGEEQLSKIKKGDDYELNLQVPVYIDLMTYASDDALREEVYKAYISRASEVGITSDKFNNFEVMKEILSLRHEMSELLGFKNYAELSIESKMVRSPEQVIDFLYDLVSRSKSQAIEELEELHSFSGKKLKPWDLMYYSEKLKEKNFGFHKSELTPYFAENNVLNGLFVTIERLYRVTITEINEESYHQDVRALEVTSNKGLVGRIYLDLYARDKKRGGAWMSDYQGLMSDSAPVAFVVCNLNSPGKNKPALFEFDEIVTIFHEFGHALHHILTKVPYPSAAGIIGVPWDGVELPSQYMEFFCYEKDVVDLMSCHWQTGKKLPEDLYDKLVMSKNFQSAMQMLRQCEFSLWDIKTHMSNEDTYNILYSVQKETSLMNRVDENRFLNTFGHIFGGGYAAGYFSYKWAEVLAADAYYFVDSDGGIGSEASKSFLTNILQIGGSLDFMDQYLKFKGSEPSVESLLISNGIDSQI